MHGSVVVITKFNGVAGPQTPRASSKPIAVGNAGRGGSPGEAAPVSRSHGVVGQSVSPLAYAGIGSDGVEDLLEGAGPISGFLRVSAPRINLLGFSVGTCCSYHARTGSCCIPFGCLVTLCPCLVQARTARGPCTGASPSWSAPACARPRSRASAAGTAWRPRTLRRAKGLRTAAPRPPSLRRGRQASVILVREARGPLHARAGQSNGDPLLSCFPGLFASLEVFMDSKVCFVLPCTRHALAETWMSCEQATAQSISALAAPPAMRPQRTAARQQRAPA